MSPAYRGSAQTYLVYGTIIFEKIYLISMSQVLLKDEHLNLCVFLLLVTIAVSSPFSYLASELILKKYLILQDYRSLLLDQKFSTIVVLSMTNLQSSLHRILLEHQLIQYFVVVFVLRGYLVILASNRLWLGIKNAHNTLLFESSDVIHIGSCQSVEYALQYFLSTCLLCSRTLH